MANFLSMFVGIGYLAALFAFPVIRFWLVAIPVVLAFLLVVAIGAWMDDGYDPASEANRRSRRKNGRGEGELKGLY